MGNKLKQWTALGLLLMVGISQLQAQSTNEKRDKFPHTIGVGDVYHGTDSTSTTHVSVSLFTNTDTLHGFNLALLGTKVNRSLKGVDLTGINTMSIQRMSGLQLSGIMAEANQMNGLQLSGVANLANTVKGMQISPFANVALGTVRGVQLSAISNTTQNLHHGLQLSALANITSGEMSGLQLSGYNYAGNLRGVQVGILNVDGTEGNGLQVGLVNFSHETSSHHFGLVSINPTTRIDILAFLGNTSIFNTALRFRNRSTYSIIGAGTHYMGLSHRFSGTLFYRLGQYIYATRNLSLSADAGFYHVETFEENSTNKPERLYSLQGHVNCDYQLTPRLGLFASLGYGDTRYYYHHKHYKDGVTAQLGLAINWKRDNAIFSNHRQRDVLYAEPADTVWAWTDPLNQRKYYGWAALQATGINVLVHCFDRFVMNEDFAQVTFKSISNNFHHAFVWDNDQFSTNLFAHPYHGNLYFNSARSYGLSFWLSAPYSLCGSLMWEFCGEVEPPAINDVMATTCGGICIGEITHRISAILLNDRSHGFRRFLREAGATLINPMQGFKRIVTGEAWRVRQNHYLYYDKSSYPIDFSITAGTRYLSDDGALFRGEFNPYITLYLEYGDVMNTDHNKPYDYFAAETSIGLSGNQPLINRLNLLGRLWSAPVYEDKKLQVQLGLFQYFNYFESKPVKNGTSLTPYRISEAAAFGPGIIMDIPQQGVINKLQQRVLLSGILLGGTKSDYYNVIDRDYNMGSGYSIKTKTYMEFRNFGRFILDVYYFKIFTWKGYEGKDLAHTDPLYLNAQGDKGNAALTVVNPIWEFDFHGPLSMQLSGNYFYRHTHYVYHKDVDAKTFELRLGVVYHF